jgi:putative PEP-CTERM system integral membrane protein
MRDPALVEQIGPRQYRLRAYPVPPLMMNFDQNTGITRVSDAPELHLWLSWTEMAAGGAAGDAWPLPQLAEKRNLYWDENTLRTVNGASFDVENDAWLPETLPAGEPITPVAHRSDLTNGQSVLAIPAGQTDLPALPDPLRLAVVLDRSRSMEPLAAEVAAALDTIREAAGSQPVDVYLTASPYRGEQPSLTTLDQLDPSSIVYFGGQNAGELLAQFEEQRLQFEEQRRGRTYDAALVISDGSGYELGENGAQISPPEMPVWLVHLGGELPLGYDDQTLEAIQASGGGVTGDIDSALARLAVSRSSQYSAASSPTADLLDGYLWLTLPTDEADSALPAGADVVTHAPGDPFTPLAARQAILAEMQRMHASLDQLENLDQLHALAVENSIVTPYSSMIVLVNFQQEQLLKDLSNLGDRYQREVEAIGETTTRSPVPLLGVPEPHEWLLLGLAAALLIYIGYTKSRKKVLVR